MKEIHTPEQLAELPHLSVVVFRGSGMQTAWQLDGEWFPAGGTESIQSLDVPPQAFPAYMIWEGVSDDE